MSNNAMKKNRKAYAKPRIAIEEFTHNQFIANCVVDTRDEDWLAKLRVRDYFTYMSVVRTKQFVESLGCEVDADVVTDDMDALCYHTSTSPLFAS